MIFGGEKYSLRCCIDDYLLLYVSELWTLIYFLVSCLEIYEVMRYFHSSEISMTEYFSTMTLAFSQRSCIAELLHLSTIQIVYVKEMSFIYSDLVAGRFC